ncbi:hypothetical protein WAI453_009158 [Rhynchosporium graminicola]
MLWNVKHLAPNYIDHPSRKGNHEEAAANSLCLFTMYIHAHTTLRAGQAPRCQSTHLTDLLVTRLKRLLNF